MVIGVLGISGFILGLLSFWGMSLLPQGNWHQLKTAPEEVVEIMDNAILNFWGGSINVRTISGKIFTYDCWGEQDCGWTLFNPTQSGEDIPNEICLPGQERKRFPAPPFPGKVVSSQIFDVCGADFTVQYNFILLEDGSIWTWDRYWSVYETILYYPLMGLSGMIVSFWCERHPVMNR